MVLFYGWGSTVSRLEPLQGGSFYCGNERINTKYKLLEKKECCMEKLFLTTLWAKLLIITVNFGNRTKDFSENFGW